MKVSIKTAEIAKEKGFDIICNDSYSDGRPHEYDVCAGCWYDPKSNQHISSSIYPFIFAPQQNILQKWLRETHNIDVDVTRDSEIHSKDEVRWIVKISDWNNIKIVEYAIAHIKHPNHFHFVDFKSYEEALEEGLLQALNLIK